MIGQTVSHYRILEKLGEGGMGVVYKAEDTTLKRLVALKFLPPEYSRDEEAKGRFFHEARAAAGLEHPNIATVFEIAEAEGQIFIAMSCVEGRTLKDRIYKSEKHAAPLPLNEAIDTAIQIGEGLAAAHKKEIVHRDIKSSNIMVTAEGQVKIMDFGLAKLKGQTKVTREGTTMGTVSYMSPEQALGKDVDQRTDIWSMGVILYEMLCGQLPFKGEYDQSIMYAIMNEKPEPVTALRSGIPMELEHIIQKALEKNREVRYQSAKEMLADLKRLKRDTESGEVAAKPGISKRPAIHWLRLLAVTSIVVILLAAAALLFKPWRSDKVSFTAANSIVVLPCKVYGAKDADYLTEAIPGSLSTLLGNVEGLETKAPITNSEFEKIQGDLGKAAALYQVQRFVQPFVTAESDQMTLNVQLLDAKTRRILWSKEYPGRRGNYLEMVHALAEDLRQKLLPDSKPMGSVSGLAANSEAELLFRQAKYYSNQYNNLHHQSDFDRAFSGMKRALELDPKMADAAAEIACLFEFKAEKGEAFKESISETGSWARRAIEIDQRCGMGWVMLGMAEFMVPRPDRHKVLEYGLKAVRFAPRNSFSHNLLNMAPIPIVLSLEATLEAYRLDALYLYGGTNLVGNLLGLGRSTEGLPYLNKILSIEPEFGYGLVIKSLILADLGRTAEAAEALKKAQEQITESSFYAPFALCAKYILALQQGDSQSPEALLKQILKIMNDPNTISPQIDIITLFLLPFLVRQGQMETALYILKRDQEAGFSPIYDALVLSPRLEPLRRDERFKPILEKFREDCVDIMKVLAQVRSRGELPRYLEAPFTDLLKKLEIKL